MKRMLYIGFVSIIILILLVACSAEKSDSQKEPNESTMSESENIKQEIEILQEKLDVLEKEQTELPLIETSSTDVLMEKLVDGEWFYQGEFRGRIDSYVFYEDGTGSSFSTNYLPADSEIMSYDPNSTGVNTYDFTWKLDDNIVTFMYDWATDASEFRFIENEEQQLQFINKNNEVSIYEKTKPAIPNDYVEEASIIKAFTDFNQNFFGTWHFDVFTWTFNQDGTGVIEIPAFGRYPSDQKRFDYLLMKDPFEQADALITINMENKGVLMYDAILGNQSGGSLTLQPKPPDNGNTILLTRSYDIRNSPITQEILDEGMALLEPLEFFIKKRR